RGAAVEEAQTTGDGSPGSRFPVIGETLNQYELVREVGSGGMGRVYLSRDLQLQRTVAVKVLPADLSTNVRSRRRFEREARAASRLNHPHIAAIYGMGESGGLHFIAMEFVEGETLKVRIARGPIPHNEVINLAIEMADALNEAHSQGIVHRDLK